MDTITLENLIAQGEQIRNGIALTSNTRYGRYEFKDENEYEIWRNKTIRFLTANYSGDRCISDFESANRYLMLYGKKPKEMDKVIAVLKGCLAVPVVLKRRVTPQSKNASEKSIQITVNQSQNQTQNQEQKQVVEIFLEAIKDELTGKQFKELKEIVKQEPNPEKAKTKVLDKIKSWSGDVLANVVANIVTNPTIWGGLLG